MTLPTYVSCVALRGPESTDFLADESHLAESCQQLFDTCMGLLVEEVAHCRVAGTADDEHNQLVDG